MKYPNRDQRTIDSVFHVWLVRDMYFHNPGKGVVTYRKYTKAKKVKYTTKILWYLDRMEASSDTVGRAVAIKLGGKIRYVWRADVLTEREYDGERESQKKKLGMLRKKSRRTMDKS